MNAPTDNAQHISLRQGLAYIVAVCTLVLPPVICWQYGPALLLGAYPVMKLVAIAGIGGVVAFALGLKEGERVAGAICGLFIGVGATGALVLYTSLFNRVSLMRGEIVLALLAGALPGILLLQWLTRAKRKLNESPPLVQGTGCDSPAS